MTSTFKSRPGTLPAAASPAGGPRVTLQINLAPSDHWHVESSLAHHLRTWAGQVAEVVLSVDTVASPGRRGAEWAKGKPKLRTILDELLRVHRNVRVVDVDYSPEPAAAVSEEFFGGEEIPAKDCFGAPFYAYLHGVHAASHPLVLHLDADMLFGGGSQTWVREASATLAGRPDVLVCAPLPGPPTVDGSIPRAIADRHRLTQRYGSDPVAQPGPSLAYAFRHVSTRAFLIDRGRFAAVVGSLRAMRLRRRTYPRGLGHPPFFPLETVMSRAMRRSKLLRLNMLGSEPGMWYLHPPARDAALERDLPKLISRVESGTIPAAQRGDDQVNSSMSPWSTRA